MIWFLSLVLLVYLLWAAFIWWRREQTRQEAVLVRNNHAEHQAIQEDQFRAAYVRTNGPRGHVYGLVSSAAALILLPVHISVVNQLWYRLWLVGGRDDVFAEGSLIHSFFLAVCSVLLFAGIAAVFMHRYHAKAPGRLDQELQQELAQ